jgi:parallel beta-helix repeat protein
VDSSDNIIGGIGVAGNLIAGYRDNGIILTGELTTNNTIQGNQIGFDSDGQPLGGNVGISIYEANNNLIGGLTAQTGNEIANQSSYGIVLSGEMNLLNQWVTKTENNKIQSNLIHNNGDVGICLNPRVGCPTLNDYYDADLGPNHLINFPVIYLADYDGAFLNLDVVMPGLINVTLTYSLDYFISSTCDPSGYGEGETFFRNESVIANMGGSIRFQRSWPAGSDVLGKYLTITATDPDGNTSEFSKCALIKYPNDVFIPLLIK